MRWSKTAAGCAVVWSALAIPVARGHGQASPPPAICREQAEFRQFDFWIGEWIVYNNVNGNLAGQNRVEARENGCVLVEHWESSAGGTGTSMNYYNSLAGTWRQIWVANNYSIEIEGGLNGDSAMVLEGQLRNYRSRQAFDFRGTWTPNADGTVRQLFERRDPETREWQVWFDGRYERRNRDANTEAPDRLGRALPSRGASGLTPSRQP